MCCLVTPLCGRLSVAAARPMRNFPSAIAASAATLDVELLGSLTLDVRITTLNRAPVTHTHTHARTHKHTTDTGTQHTHIPQHRGPLPLFRRPRSLPTSRSCRLPSSLAAARSTPLSRWLKTTVQQVSHDLRVLRRTGSRSSTSRTLRTRPSPRR